MPMRVTCKLIKKEKLVSLPPLMEGEALACRIVEMGPVGTQFLGYAIILSTELLRFSNALFTVELNL
jgi:ankyrin